MHFKALLTIVLTLFVPLLFLGGCADSLRFAPSESQKQTAELTHLLAAKVNAEGAVPASPATTQLVAGARAAVSYIGRPDSPADPEQFDTTAAQANADALGRPDPWTVADSALELGIGIAALAGGVSGAKAVKFLKTAQEKSKALQEIVQNNEVFMKAADADTKQNFKIEQQAQSPATKRIVTEVKAGA